MKKLFIPVLVFCAVHSAQAQITLQPGIPVAGLIQKNQLWNIMVINSTTRQYECRLEMVLRERSTGMEIMTASTGSFIISAGVKQLNTGLLEPVQYNYLSAGIDNRLQGLVQAGAYTACFTLTALTDKDAKLAEECVQFDAEPLNPPMLIFPADSAVLETAPAQFSWTPPTPVEMFDKLRYEILVTKINDGQKPAEAIQENIPFYSDNYLLVNTMNYPPSSVAFEKEQWYAWQIVAKDDKNYAGKSEVWVFKISPDKPRPDASSESYIFINSNASDKNIFYIGNRELRIKYYSTDKRADAALMIRTLEGNTVQEIRQAVVYGDNYFKVKLSENVKKGKLYVAEIEDIRNKKYTIVFSVN